MSRNVNTPPGLVYTGGGPPLELPLVQMSSAEATAMYGQPQIYDEPYPLDYSGLQIGGPWWADTGAGGTLNGMGDVGGGNVRLMPWEKGYGFSGLGLTPAQQKAADNKAKAAATQAERQRQAAIKQQAASQAKQQKAAEQQQRQQQKQSPAQSTGSSSSSRVKDYSAQMATCQKKSGTWDPLGFKCILPIKPTAAQNKLARDKANCQKKTGYSWNETSGTCTIVPAVDPNIALQQQCDSSGGFWDSVAKKCAPKVQRDCQSSGGTWDPTTGICTPAAAQQDCINSGGTWANGLCTPAANTGSTPGSPGTPPVPCPPGYYEQVDPGFDGGPRCRPIQQQPGVFPGGSGGGGGGIPPGPLPSFDPSAGGVTAAGMPIMSQGATGGGFPMQQGQGPTAFDESSGEFDTAPMTPQPEDGNADQEDNGTKDSTADVAEGNVLESLSKMFGFGSLSCGCNKPPTWFNDGPGGNAPMLGEWARQPVTPPVPRSTETAVYMTALVAVVGAAAIFLWSKSGRK